jgi:hypothetical protein
MRVPSTTWTAVLMLAACGPAPADRPAAKAAPAAARSAPPSAPLEADASVEPLSNTATAITGPATFTEGSYSFALGQRYLVEPEAAVGADVKWSAGGGSWADLLGIDSGGEVEVVRVTDQTVDPATARNGGLCGPGKVRWIATARTADDVGAEVVMAAFSGARPPGPLGRDEDLCGTFNYASGN